MPDTIKNEPLWSDVLSLAEDLLYLITASTPKIFEVRPAIYGHIIGMFWRARRLYEGTLILLKAELPEEAAILARSLFEEALRLQQLASDSTDRDALIYGWANSSTEHMRGLFELGKACGLDNDNSAPLALIEQHRQQLRNSATQRGVNKSKRFLSVKDAAFRFGRKEDYWTYEWSHESVHGSEGAWLFSRRTPAKNMAGLYAKNSDSVLRAGFAHFAARSFTDSAKVISTIFGLTLPPGSEEIPVRIEQLLESIKTRKGDEHK